MNTPGFRFPHIIALAKPLHITPKKQRMHVPLEEFTYKGGEAVQDSQSNSLMQQFKEEESAQLVELTDEEIRNQVLELHALGNSSSKIQEILFTQKSC